MEFQSDHVYHIYNRGNNKRSLFFSRDNYLYFLAKLRKEILPLAEILAYCLMPNHYHLLLLTKDTGQTGSMPGAMHPLARKIGTVQSSYTQAINKQKNFAGSLFQPKAKSVDLTENDDSFYLLLCFHYIHQNPFVAGLVNKIEDWEFSSFRDYIGLRNGALCNQETAYHFIDGIVKSTLYEDAYKTIPDYKIEKLMT